MGFRTYRNAASIFQFGEPQWFGKGAFACLTRAHFGFRGLCRTTALKSPCTP